MRYFQDTFEERCSSTGAPIVLSFFTATWSLLFLITNIPCNLLIILAVYLDPHKKLRNPFNYLMSNLAAADLIVGVITCPFFIYFHIKEGLRRYISKAEIQVLHILYFISCTASVLSFASLAVERYLATRYATVFTMLCFYYLNFLSRRAEKVSIQGLKVYFRNLFRHPHSYRSKCTDKRVLGTVALIWLISLTLPCVYFEVGFITYSFIFANTSVFIASAITCVIYVVMVRKFRTQKTGAIKDNPVRSKPKSRISNEQMQERSVTSTNRRVTSAASLEHKITKMFLVVMVTLLCCYGPSTVMIYIMCFCDKCSCAILHWFRDAHILFIFMHSSLNFFSYALRSQRFKQAFIYILKRPTP